jgi:hypothetical protein
VGADEREWLERLVGVAERALIELGELDDPTNLFLLADLDELRERLLRRLAQEPPKDS